MSHDTATEHKPHVLPVKVYAAVFVGLLILTVVTVWVSYFHFGFLNLAVAMGIATMKASLVVLFFMHLKYDEGFNAIIFIGTLVFLLIFFVLTLADTMERGRVDPIEAREIVPVPARPELMEHGAGHGTEAGHGEAETQAPAHGEEPAAAGSGEEPAAGEASEDPAHGAAPADSTQDPGH